MHAERRAGISSPETVAPWNYTTGSLCTANYAGSRLARAPSSERVSRGHRNPGRGIGTVITAIYYTYHHAYYAYAYTRKRIHTYLQLMYTRRNYTSYIRLLCKYGGADRTSSTSVRRGRYGSCAWLYVFGARPHKSDPELV